MSDNNSNSANTVLVSVIIILLIGAAAYFGFIRGNGGDKTPATHFDINATVPVGAPGGSATE